MLFAFLWILVMLHFYFYPHVGHFVNPYRFFDYVFVFWGGLLTLFYLCKISVKFLLMLYFWLHFDDAFQYFCLSCKELHNSKTLKSSVWLVSHVSTGRPS